MNATNNVDPGKTAAHAASEKPPHNMPELFTVTELTRYLQVSRSTVYRLIEGGSLNCIRIGGALRFTSENIQELIKYGSRDNGI